MIFNIVIMYYMAHTFNLVSTPDPTKENKGQPKHMPLHSVAVHKACEKLAVFNAEFDLRSNLELSACVCIRDMVFSISCGAPGDIETKGGFKLHFILSCHLILTKYKKKKINSS